MITQSCRLSMTQSFLHPARLHRYAQAPSAHQPSTNKGRIVAEGKAIALQDGLSYAASQTNLHFHPPPPTPTQGRIQPFLKDKVCFMYSKGRLSQVTQVISPSRYKSVTHKRGLDGGRGLQTQKAAVSRLKQSIQKQFPEKEVSRCFLTLES